MTVVNVLALGLKSAHLELTGIIICVLASSNVVMWRVLLDRFLTKQLANVFHALIKTVEVSKQTLKEEYESNDRITSITLNRLLLLLQRSTLFYEK